GGTVERESARGRAPGCRGAIRRCRAGGAGDGALHELEDAARRAVDGVLDDGVHARLSEAAAKAGDLAFDAYVSSAEGLAKHRAERRVGAALRAHPDVDVGHSGSARRRVRGPGTERPPSRDGEHIELEPTAVRVAPGQAGARIAATRRIG